MAPQFYWVYILHCDNDTFYTGYTNDLTKRFQLHVKGTGSKYTRSFKPLKIVFSKKMDSKSAAMKVERKIKKLSRAQKESLVADPEASLLLFFNDLL